MDKDPAGQNADPRPTDPLQAEDKPFGFLRRAGVISGMGLAVLGAAPNLVGTVGGEAGNAVAEASANPGQEHRAGAKQNVVVTAPSLRQVAGEYPELSKVRKNIRSYNVLPKNKEKRIVFGGALDPSQVKIIGAPAKEGYVATDQVNRYAVLWQYKIDRTTGKEVAIYKAEKLGQNKLKLKKGQRLFAVRVLEEPAKTEAPTGLPENPSVVSTEPLPQPQPNQNPPTQNEIHNETPAPELSNEQFEAKETQKFLEEKTVNLEVVNASGTRLGADAVATSAHVFYIPKTGQQQVLVERYVADGKHYMVFMRPAVVSGGTSRDNFETLGEIKSVALPLSDEDTAFVSMNPDRSAVDIAEAYNREIKDNLTQLQPGEKVYAAGWPLNISAGRGTENLQRWQGEVLDRTAVISMGPLPNTQRLSTTLVAFKNSQEGFAPEVWSSGMQLFTTRVEGTGSNRRLVTREIGTYSAKIALNPSYNQEFVTRYGLKLDILNSNSTLGFVARPDAAAGNEGPRYMEYFVVGLGDLPAGATLLTTQRQ